jgi:hypothetical protein
MNALLSASMVFGDKSVAESTVIERHPNNIHWHFTSATNLSPMQRHRKPASRRR